MFNEIVKLLLNYCKIIQCCFQYCSVAIKYLEINILIMLYQISRVNGIAPLVPT